MKVVFLDIDGVLVNGKTSRSGERAHGRNVPDPVCVARLNEITRRTGAHIVISSTWRMLWKEAELRRLLVSDWGVIGAISGVTPVLTPSKYGSIATSSRRGREIKTWLRGEVGRRATSFVILDDDDDMEDVKWRLVQTNFEVGLSDVDVEKAVKLLETPWRKKLEASGKLVLT